VLAEPGVQILDKLVMVIHTHEVAVVVDVLVLLE
jgi:hypothetical protein